MWWSEICSIKPKFSKFAEVIHDMCTPIVLIWSFCLCPYNHEKINTSSVQSGGGRQSFASNAKAAEESLTALLHTVNLNTACTVWRKEQDALNPAIWQNSPFSRAATWLQRYCWNWTHSVRHWNNYSHYSLLFSLCLEE